MTCVRLLGPVDVLDDDGTIHAPKTPLRRTLLALLAIESRHVVESDRLLERIWDGSPPTSGRRALRFHMSRLRREVPVENLVVTVPGGYRLDADTDADDVESELDEMPGMDPAHRVDLTRTLLRRWRGEPLLDTEDCVTLDHERLRLAELQLTLTEHLFGSLVESGATTTVISDLIGLCLEHPLREHLWAALITAQYRSGLQADALRSYDRLRRNLLDEIGADPSPQLRELEQRILEHSPVLGQPDAGVRSTPHHGGNLIASRLGLIGRDDETRSGLEALAAHRVVTFTGVGGVGKTSLARAVAERFGSRSTETWWIELAPLTNPDDVLSTVASALDITAPMLTATDLTGVLRHRGDVLIVLDNCEHIAEAAGRVAQALTDGDHVRVLATSRVPLGSRREHVLRLGPLDDLVSAAELFVREARRRDPTFVTGQGRHAVIDAICEQVDRIPLAIELVAARSWSLGLGEIFDQLSEILATRPHQATSDDRHATMTAAIKWSTEMLDHGAADGLGALTVLAGTFDLSAATALLDLVTNRPAFDVIDVLVSHSLVEPIRSRSGIRYRILEPVRQFAAESLLDDAGAARDRHLEHFLDRLEAAYKTFGTTSFDPLLDILEHDLENLRALHDWALDSGRIDDDLRLYRPLMIANLHERFVAGSWATETVSLDDVELHERWREALALALATAVFRSEWTLDERATALVARARNCGHGVGSDLIDAILGWVECMREQRHVEGLARLDGIESGDTFARYMGYSVGSLYRAFLSDDPLAVGRAGYAAGIEWTCSIGAKNLEAGMLMMSVHIEQLLGEPQDAHDIADAAARKAAAVDMRHMEVSAVFQRVRATLRGATSSHDPVDDLLELMRGAVAVGGTYRQTQLLNVAAQVLTTHGLIEAAAVAGLAGDSVSAWQWHWREHIPADAIARAERRIELERLDVHDITDQTIAHFEHLIERTGTPDPEANPIGGPARGDGRQSGRRDR